MTGRAYSFCPICGADLVEKRFEAEDRARKTCSACDFIHYANPIPAAGVVLVDRGKVLLVKRKFEPRVGMWTLPAGFVESGEGAAECAIRETKEETNLDVELTRLFNVYSAFDDPRAAVVLILYVGRLVGGELRCGDDASDARFFSIPEVPGEIAFKAHRLALAEVKEQFGVMR